MAYFAMNTRYGSGAFAANSYPRVRVLECASAMWHPSRSRASAITPMQDATGVIFFPRRLPEYINPEVDS